MMKHLVFWVLIGGALSLGVIPTSRQVLGCGPWNLAPLTTPGPRREQLMTSLRGMGALGLSQAMAFRNGLGHESTELNDAIDQIAGQRYGHLSGLYWHTDWDAARGESQATGKPILALRMLGNLTEEYSCANSRFFRTTLYIDPEIAQFLKEHFILHWKSMRPIPRITVDFGDGRKLERTLTGNSAHFATLADGTVLDVLPGLYGPAAFRAWLMQMERLAKTCGPLSAEERLFQLNAFHAKALSALEDSASAGTQSSFSSNEVEESVNSGHATAATASVLTPTKRQIEEPLYVAKETRRRASRGPR